MPQFGGQGKPSVGIVFDADLGNTIDDALALATLYGLQGKQESRVIGVTVSKPSLKAAAFAETLVRFYTSAPGPFGGVGSNPPVGQAIGLATTGRPTEETPMMTAVLAKQSPEGKLAYLRTIEKTNDTADPVAVMRNALSAQFDQNAIVVMAGPATNLANALAMPDFKGWVTKKVRYLCVAAGAYPNGGPEPAIQADIAAAKKLFAEWPGEIIAVGPDVGEAVPFPGAGIEKDFAWSPSHPVVDAYRAYKPMPYDAPSHAMAAVLHAVRPQEKYFKVSDPGVIAVTDDGRTRFTPAADGKHRFLMPDPEQKARILAAYAELASAKPPAPQQRFRPPQKKQ